MRARRAGAPAAASLRGERRGRVASAGERVLVLLLDDGPLVALLPAGAPLHPWAVELDGPLPRGVGEGDAVRVTGDDAHDRAAARGAGGRGGRGAAAAPPAPRG